MNKIKSLLKRSPIAMVVAGVLVAGIASAAVLVYYGKITGKANIEQSVVLDGGASVLEVIDEVDGVAGNIVYGNNHWLENKAGVDAVVSLDSTCQTGEYCDGIEAIVPEFHLEPVIGSENNDEDDIHFLVGDTIWANFSNVSFEYIVDLDNTGGKAPHVNLMLRGPQPGQFCLISVNPGEADIEELENGWKLVTYGREDFYAVLPENCTPGDNWEFNSVTIESGDPGDINTDGDLQRVWVRKPAVIAGNSVLSIGWFRVPEKDYGSIPARTVWFRMGYDFMINAYGGTYTVETVVTPHGEYAQGGVYTP